MRLRSSVNSPIDKEIIKETKITLTAVGHYASYMVSYDGGDDYIFPHYSEAAYGYDRRVSAPATFSVPLDQWDVEIEVTRDETFNKLEEVYGYMKALEIFRVLKGIKPEQVASQNLAEWEHIDYTYGVNRCGCRDVDCQNCNPEPL